MDALKSSEKMVSVKNGEPVYTFLALDKVNCVVVNTQILNDR